jgi:hypothetical protein
MSLVGIQIEYWSILSRFSIPAKQYVKDVVNRFETRTGAKVNIKFKRREDIVDGTYKTLFDGGTRPDVFDCPTHLTADFIHTGQLRDLQSVYDQFDGTLNTAIAHFDVLRAQQNIRCGTTKFDVPLLWWDPGAFLIRKDHMDNAGLTSADFGTTEKFITSLEAIKDAGITEYPFQIVGNANHIGMGLPVSLFAAESSNANDGNYFDGLVSTSLNVEPSYLPDFPRYFIPVFGASDGFTNTVRTNVLSWWASLIHGHPTASGKVLSRPVKDNEEHADAMGRFATGKTSCINIPAPYRGAVLRLMKKELDQGKITWLPSLRTDKLLNDDGSAEYDAPWPVARPAILMHALAHYCPVQASPDTDKESAAQELINEFMTYDNQFELATIAGPCARTDAFTAAMPGSGELQEFLNAYSQNPLLTADEEFSSSLDGAQAVPPVVTNASGSAALSLSNGNTLNYTISVADIATINFCRLHQLGPSGNIVATLYDGTGPVFDEANPLVGDVVLSAFDVSLLITNRLYIDIEVVTHRGSEIAGQILTESIAIASPRGWYNISERRQMEGQLLYDNATKPALDTDGASSAALAADWVTAVDGFFKRPGEDALNILGATNFGVVTNWAASPTPAADNMDEAKDLLYVGHRDQLWAMDRRLGRIQIFDLSGGISNGMSATYVFGVAAGNVLTSLGVWPSSTPSSPRIMAMAYDETNKRLYLATVLGSNSTIYVYDDSGVNPLVGTFESTNPAFLYRFALNGFIANDIVIDEVAQKLYVSTYGSGAEASQVKVFDVSSGTSAVELGAYGVYNPIAGFEDQTIFYSFDSPLSGLQVGAGPLLLDPVHHQISAANSTQVHNRTDLTKSFVSDTPLALASVPHVVAWDTREPIPAVPGASVGTGGVADRTGKLNRNFGSAREESYGVGLWTYIANSGTKMVYYAEKDQVIVAEAPESGTGAVKVWCGGGWREPWNRLAPPPGNLVPHLYSFGYRKTPAPPAYPGFYNSGPAGEENPSEQFAIKPGAIALDNTRGHLFVVHADRSIRVFQI